MVRYDSRIIRVMQVYGRLTTACSINKHYNYYLITHLLVTVEAGSIIINPMLLACLLELFISKLGRGTYYRRKVFSCFSFVAFFNCWDSAFSQTAPPPLLPLRHPTSFLFYHCCLIITGILILELVIACLNTASAISS